MNTLLQILITMGLVVLNGYFVAAEFAAVSARYSRLEAKASTDLMARMGLTVKKQLDLYLSTCQLGITIASLALGYVTEPLVAELLSPLLNLFGLHSTPGNHHPAAIIIALTISTSMHVVVGEQAPKNWAIQYGDRLLPILAGPLIVFTYIFYPFIWILNTASNALLRLTGIEIKPSEHGLPHTEGELKALLAQAVSSGTIEKGDERVLTGAFELGELKVRQIMTPRTRVDFLKIGQPIGQVLQTVQKSSFTRLPLCEDDVDHVIGMVHMKDLFNHLKLVPGKLKFTDEKTPDGEAIAIANGMPGSAVHVIGSGDLDLLHIKRDVLYVPELLPVPKLLKQFQASRIHMAVVVDEYGATQGIVTLEDVIEEIVGEIEDEFDDGKTPDFVIEGESFRVNGSFAMHELREKLAMGDFDPGDVDTIAGYAVLTLGRFPRVGDTFSMGNYIVRIVKTAQNTVQQVLIMPATQQVRAGRRTGESVDARLTGASKRVESQGVARLHSLKRNTSVHESHKSSRI